MEDLKLIERYTLIERVAEGTYGQVYKARSNSTKELVAVKRFKPSARIGLPISFVREHYVLAQLSGPNVPQLLQVFAGEEPVAMVMEWLSLTLEGVVRSKRKYAYKQIFQEILQGVDYLHTCGVIHRDLKPSNIMLGSKSGGNGPVIEPVEISPAFYWVKLIDFGMAREVASEGRNMTNQVGSLFYRAPELLLGQRRYTSKVDVWSLGCIFYFMQTGSVLFKGTSQIDQLRAIVSVLGAQAGQVSERTREGLMAMKVEGVSQNWNLIDKHLNEIEFDLLKKMIALQPERRLSCKQLLFHPYFM